MIIEKKQHKGLKISLFVTLGLLLVVGGSLGAYFGYQFITKTGVFKIPGVVTYAENLTEEEIEKFKSIFNDELILDENLNIYATETLEKPELENNQFLTNVFVPTTSFYSAETSVDSKTYFVDGKLQQCNCGVTWIDFEDLSFNQTLLAVDGNYYLDTFDKGAIYRYITFESTTYTKEIEPLVKDLFTKTLPTSDEVLTFAQTGVTALSRGMHTKLVQNGYDGTYFSKNIKDFLSKFDLTHTSNESSFTNGAYDRNICSNPAFVNTLLDIGLDIVELTGNHNNDCGFDAARESIDIYKEHGIKTVGGGKNAEEAAQPLEISEKGNNITFIAYNQSTGGATLGNYPGANQYYEEDAKNRIKAAKDKGDFVIVDIQYYECNAYASTYEDPICDRANSSAGDQIGFFRHFIDLGADMVVGTSAHQAQTYELYGNGVIYYGLGNLFFDQVWWPGTTRSLVLAHYFKDGKLLQTKIVPTVYDSAMQPKVMDEETRAWFLNRLMSVRP